MKIKRLSLMIVLTCVSLVAGCTPATEAPTATPQPEPTATPTPEPVATIDYIGHSCAVITAPDGTRIVVDPYNDSHAPVEIYDFPPDVAGDALTISHFHADHNNQEAIGGDPQIFYRVGEYQVGQVQITGYEGDHGLTADGEEFNPTWDNVVFVFEMAGIKIVHLGAQGIITQPDILEALEGADVVFVCGQGGVAHPTGEQIDQLRDYNVGAIILTHYSLGEAQRFYNAPTAEEIIDQLPDDLAVVQPGTSLEVTPGMAEQFVVMTPIALDYQE